MKAINEAARWWAERIDAGSTGERAQFEAALREIFGLKAICDWLRQQHVMRKYLPDEPIASPRFSVTVQHNDEVVLVAARRANVYPPLLPAGTAMVIKPGRVIVRWLDGREQEVYCGQHY